MGNFPKNWATSMKKDAPTPVHAWLVMMKAMQAITRYALANLEDTGLSTNPVLGTTLHEYFTWATTTTMARYHASADDVPDGMSIPKWSWCGLES